MRKTTLALIGAYVVTTALIGIWVGTSFVSWESEGSDISIWIDLGWWLLLPAVAIVNCFPAWNTRKEAATLPKWFITTAWVASVSFSVLQLSYLLFGPVAPFTFPWL